MNEKKKSVRDAYAKYKENPELNQDVLLKALESYRESWFGERRKSQDKQIQHNIAFYAGNHYVRDASAGSSSYKVRLRENHTNNTINRMLSIFVQNLPITRVFPSDIKNEDIQNAENSELYAKYFWRQKKIELKLIKLIKYTLVCANGFLFRQYDPDLGGEMVLDESETKSGDPEVRKYKGDIRLDVDDPFRYGVRPGIDEWDDMYDFIRSVPANKYELEAKYGSIEADPVTGYNAYTGTSRQDDEIVMQHHYFHKPTPWFEEGLYVCWAGKRILRVRKASKCEEKLPAVHLPFDKPPMRFWGMSSIEQIMDLQEQLNRAASMIIEARNLIARPRVMVANEAKMPGQSIDDRPGSIWRFAKEGGAPIPVVPSFNFAEMSAHKADVRNALSQVSGITSASRGEIPAATRTALALQLVLEQDRSQYAPFIKQFYQSILDVMTGVLDTAAEYFDESDPRVIKVEGYAGSRTFHGKMIPSPLDMYLEDTNPLGWTAGGRVEQIGNLVEWGILKDRNQVLEMLKINSPDPAFQSLKINKEAAIKENELLAKGHTLDVLPEDDDATHLDEHVKPVQSFSFRSLPSAVQDAYLAHIEQHKQRISAAMAPPAPGPEPAGGVKPAEAAEIVRPQEPGANLPELLAK